MYKFYSKPFGIQFNKFIVPHIANAGALAYGFMQPFLTYFALKFKYTPIGKKQLRTFSSSAITPNTVCGASVAQLKHLISDYRLNYESSAYTILWHTALIYVINAILDGNSCKVSQSACCNLCCISLLIWERQLICAIWQSCQTFSRRCQSGPKLGHVKESARTLKRNVSHGCFRATRVMPLYPANSQQVSRWMLRFIHW